MKDNIVYVKTENGIFKCYESETMHKPIYHLVNSNGYIEYTEVIKVLTIDDLFIENQELKKHLKELEEHSANAINKQVARGINLINQQKEFIEYLEDYIDVLKDQQDGIEGLDIAEEHVLMNLEEVLSKYKEISGLE